MKLYEAFQKSGFHTTVMTTFGVEFDAFESIVLSRLRGAGCRNVLLVCDADMLSLALVDENTRPKLAGSNYLVAKARASGVFHPKVVVQIGRDRGRLIIASANATASGLAGNLELAAMIECGAEDSAERRLVLSGWSYALRFLDPRQRAVQDKLSWATDRSPWLNGDVAGTGYVQLADGTRAAFLSTGDEAGLAVRYVDLIEDRQDVERLTVLSPYWDEELGAVAGLRSLLRPRKTVLLVDAKRKAFPAHALAATDPVQVSDLEGLGASLLPANNSRFIHAKMIVATVGGMDHILFGSANCTLAALGNARHPGVNEEACLYRRLPAGKVFEALSLKPLLTKSGAIEIKDIPEMVHQEQLPLGEMKARDPGTFELVYEDLCWWPGSQKLASEFDSGSSELEILDAKGRVLSVNSALVPSPSKERKFRLKYDGSRIAFARFRRPDGTCSGTAIVAHVQDLRSQTRDPLTANTERAIRELEFDDDEGLWLLGVIQTLSAPPAERSVAVAREPGSRKKPEANAMPAALDYETFMRGRRREIKHSEAERNALAGSPASFVRAALNRMLGLRSAASFQPQELLEDQEAADALDTGDETSGAQEAIEKGFDPQDPGQSTKAALDASRRRRRADVAAIVTAVDQFIEEVREPTRTLDEIDTLRLRAMLMIIAVAGWPGPHVHSYKPSHLQVLPCHDMLHTETWPRLMGRVLAAVFSGPKPAVRRLKFDPGNDRLSDDLLETLACCVWCADAAAAATRANPASAKLQSILAALSASTRRMLQLSKEELTSASFAGVVTRLDERFGERLRLPRLAEEVLKIPAPPGSGTGAQ